MSSAPRLTCFFVYAPQYDKPFFSTYFKTSLFMVYLTGFVFYRPWRQQLTADPGASALAAAIVRRSGDNGRDDIMMRTNMYFISNVHMLKRFKGEE